MKIGSEMRVFHDLLTHLNSTMVLRLRRIRISAMSSSGMIGVLDCDRFLVRSLFIVNQLHRLVVNGDVIKPKLQ